MRARHLLAAALAWMATLLVACAHAQQGIAADVSVRQVRYDDFKGLTASEVWHEINELDFWSIPKHSPPGYYDTVTWETAATLRLSIHDTIDGHSVIPYNTSGNTPASGNHRVDIWDVIALADAHPIQSDHVLDLYLNATLPRQSKGGVTGFQYDREHVWPKSLGFPKNSTSNPAYSDAHHLFAAYSAFNSLRGDMPFGSGVINSDDRRPTVWNMQRGGSQRVPAAHNYQFTNRWQTWDGRRGDVARAVFYMAVRYEGGTNEPDLTLTDDLTKIRTLDVWEDGGEAFMGLLSTLLEWHAEDPVDDLERRRNGVVYLFQGNRNPFIDKPEWAPVVFGAESVASLGPSPSGGGEADNSPARDRTAWINEFHYDNRGRDQNEFVEIAAPGGTDLTGWEIVAYNGQGGEPYKTLSLSGTIPGTAGDLGVVAFDIPGLQNGEPDGLALVDSNGSVRDLISYEGTFTASGGPASGLVAPPIGVAETAQTEPGRSLQRTGTGRTADSFVWTGPSVSSKGQINSGQVLSDE